MTIIIFINTTTDLYRGMRDDKGKLYIYFYFLILNVCVLFITILWAFTCDFYIIGNTWVKGSKKRQNRTKWAENRESWGACRDMVLACRGMTPHHTSFREQHVVTWSFCIVACYVSQIKNYRRHAVGGASSWWKICKYCTKINTFAGKGGALCASISF